METRTVEITFASADITVIEIDLSEIEKELRPMTDEEVEEALTEVLRERQND